MGQRRGGLGRGLDALIQAPAVEGGVLEIDIDAIGPNPSQPRERFDEAALVELAESIRMHGVLQPVIVTRSEAAEVPYVLVAGERRWRAARLAGLATVPAIVREVSPRHTLELALIENLQRTDLTPLEQARAYQELIERFGLTQAEVAQRVGKSRAAVANALRLLQAPPSIQEALSRGTITEGHARALLGLSHAADQIAALAVVIEQGLSVRQTEQLVRRWQQTPRRRAPRRSPPEEIQHIATLFQRALGTRVDVRPGKHGGRVVIHYYSNEELAALYQRLVGHELDEEELRDEFEPGDSR